MDNTKYFLRFVNNIFNILIVHNIQYKILVTFLLNRTNYIKQNESRNI